MFIKGLSKEKIERCVKCGICLGSCPVYRITRSETDSPRGRLEMMRAFEGNAKEHGMEHIGLLEDNLKGCLFCLRCKKDCPAGIEFDLCLFNTMERLFIGRGSQGKGSECIRGSIRPADTKKQKVSDWMTEESGVFKDRHSRAMIFPGCFITRKEIELIHAKLRDSGADCILPPEGICCGLPYLLRGETKEAMMHIEQNCEIFKCLNIDILLTPCPFCLNMFESYYPILSKREKDIAFKHITDIITPLKMIQRAHALQPAAGSFELSPVWEKGKGVTYHAPCVLDRKRAIIHRDMIMQLAGDAYIEIKDPLCCGNGFELPQKKAHITKRIRRSNLDKIRDRGVDIIITDCPSCTESWRQGIHESGFAIEVIPFWMLMK